MDKLFSKHVGKVVNGWNDWLSIPLPNGKRFGLVFLDDYEYFFFGRYERTNKESDNG